MAIGIVSGSPDPTCYRCCIKANLVCYLPQASVNFLPWVKSNEQENIARFEDGAAFSHIHMSISDDAMGVHAGHLFNAVVEVVAEIHIRIMKDVIMTRCPVENSSFIALKFE